jgi:hypothetical protein
MAKKKYRRAVAVKKSAGGGGSHLAIAYDGYIFVCLVE